MLRRVSRDSLSVVCRSAAAGPRAAAVLATLRGAADEIVVAVDSRSDPAARADVAAVADRIIVYPYADPVDRATPWLFAQSRCDWVFSIDDDEIPSLGLLDALSDLLADADVAHCSFPVRWLYPDTSTYLDDWPWEPHYAARLLRNDGRTARFTDEMHRSILTAGPGRFVPLPLWHADALLRSTEERLAKAARYERERPGQRIAGRAFNYAFYVPELRTDPPLAPLPPEERTHVEAVLGARSSTGAPRARIEEASRDEIDRYWPVSAPAAQDGRVELLSSAPAALFAGEERTIDVRVHNTGRAAWPWGRDGVPEVRVGSCWFDGGNELGELEIHTTFPAPLAPGREDLVPAHVRAPDEPGDYRLSFRLVQQHVRWFGAAAEFDVTVVPQRRLAVVGDDEAASEIARVLATLPELELVRLRRAPSSRPIGYPEAPDGRAFLFDDAPSGRLPFAAVLLWRSLRLRIGPTPAGAVELVDTLRRCELLVVAGTEGPDERRERWALAALERTARSVGLPVAATRDPQEVLQLLRDRT